MGIKIFRKAEPKERLRCPKCKGKDLWLFLKDSQYYCSDCDFNIIWENL